MLQTMFIPAFSQYDVDSLEVYNPPASTEVNLVAYLTCASLGFFKDSISVEKNANLITVKGNYSRGPFSAESHRVDTVNLGTLTEGLYSAKFIIKGSNKPTPSDTGEISFSIDVDGHITSIIGIATTDNIILIFPNPTSDKINFANVQEGSNVKFFNLEGKLTKELLYEGQELELDELVAGAYIIQVEDLSGRTSQRRFFKN